ncbi:MAG TPA: YciI family protein [Actinocrinis sp.]|nr:YciI family protein [Actinocrinis sp.]
MSQYLLSVHMVEGASARPAEDNEKAYAQVDALNAELMEKGAFVFGGGLHAPQTATVVRVSGDEILTTDGPFIEGKEHVGGFWVIEAEDLDAALAWAAKATRACMEPVEVRPFQGLPD